MRNIKYEVAQKTLKVNAKIAAVGIG